MWNYRLPTPSQNLESLTSYEVHVNASAKDDSDPGNAAMPGTWTFTTGTTADTTAPSITDVAVNPGEAFVGGRVNISAQVNDDTALSGVTVHVTGPALDANLTMEGAGDRWFLERTYEDTGTHDFTIWATDGAGNVASASGSFTIREVAATPLDPLLWLLLAAAAAVAAALLVWRLRRRRSEKRPPQNV